MAALPELQMAFGAALRDGPTPDLWALFSEPPAVAERRLAAYRRNVIGNWRSALASTYPVVAQLLGPQRFRELADQYIAAHPSGSGDLNTYGSELALLLAASALSEAHPYLPDMARLEWALLLAYGAVDAGPFDLAALAAVPAAAQATLRLQVWTGSALIESAWPLVDIWQAHQLAPDERDAALAGIDVFLPSPAPCRALVARIDGRVSARALSAGEAALLRALQSALALGDALAAALAEGPGLDPGAVLQRLVAWRTLTGFQENENE